MYSRLTMCIVSPCAVCISNVICVTITVSRNVFRWMFIRVRFWYQFCDVLVPKVSPCSRAAKCTVMELWHTTNPTYCVWQWFKHQHCLDCHMLLLWQLVDWSVELKIDISMNLLYQKVTKESLQQSERFACYVALKNTSFMMTVNLENEQ